MSVLSNIAGGINVAGSITNILSDATIKDFYSLRDFYNFIRKDNNCPMSHTNFFTVVPQVNMKGFDSLINTTGNDFLSNVSKTAATMGKALWDKTIGGDATNINPEEFSFNEYNLARFALSLTNFSSLPALKIGNNKNSDLDDIPYGHKSMLPVDGGLKCDSYTFTATFIEMANPIIESFIIPWMIYLQKNDITKTDINPRLDLVIKFYRADEIAGLEFLMNPTFIYKFTNVYPRSATLVTPQHGKESSTASTRSVTFAFDNCMVFSNATYEKFITGTQAYFAYSDLSPVQILNKLNYQAGNVATVYNQIKNTF